MLVCGVNHGYLLIWILLISTTPKISGEKDFKKDIY